MDLTEIRNRVMKVTGHMDVDDIDSEINMVQRQYIQPAAKIGGETTLTTQEDHQTFDLADIADDIYLLNFVRDITYGMPGGQNIPLLRDSSTGTYGARYHNGRLDLPGVGEGKKILVAYYRRLPDLGEGEDEVTEPGIPAQWHDLYWLGAAGMINPERFFSIFHDRLAEFKRERTREARPYGQRMNTRGWW